MIYNWQIGVIVTVVRATGLKKGHGVFVCCWSIRMMVIHIHIHGRCTILILILIHSFSFLILVLVLILILILSDSGSGWFVGPVPCTGGVLRVAMPNRDKHKRHSTCEMLPVTWKYHPRIYRTPHPNTQRHALAEHKVAPPPSVEEFHE